MDRHEYSLWIKSESGELREIKNCSNHMFIKDLEKQIGVLPSDKMYQFMFEDQKDVCIKDRASKGNMLSGYASILNLGINRFSTLLYKVVE